MGKLTVLCLEARVWEACGTGVHAWGQIAVGKLVGTGAVAEGSVIGSPQHQSLKLWALLWGSSLHWNLCLGALPRVEVVGSLLRV